MWAQAVVSVEVVDDESVAAQRDAVLRPGFQHRSPVRVVEATPVLLHAPDAVVVVRDRLSLGVDFQQFHRVRHGFRAEPLFVPHLAIELEEPARPTRFGRFIFRFRNRRAVGIADEELHVDVPDHFDATLMNLTIEIHQPLAILVQANDWKVSGITFAVRRVCQAPKVSTVETDLSDVRFRIREKRQVVRIGVFRPVSYQRRELSRLRRFGLSKRRTQ